MRFTASRRSSSARWPQVPVADTRSATKGMTEGREKIVKA
jgi:hypothetical protein